MSDLLRSSDCECIAGLRVQASSVEWIDYPRLRPRTFEVISTKGYNVCAPLVEHNFKQNFPATYCWGGTQFCGS